MGGTTYNSADWDTYRSTTSKKSTHEIFTSRGMHESLDPKKIVRRESRDSDVNPVTMPIIAATDVTGSMGVLARQIATKGLGQIFEELLTRKPVAGPQFAFMGIGDVYCDRAPLQVSQFESDTASLVPQLEALFLEGGGGGNSHESYNLPWYFAATRMVHDSFVKRGKPGYLFTIGDEEVPPDLTEYQLASVFGQGEAISNRELLKLISPAWNVFHIMVEQGSHMSYRRDKVIASWKDLLGQRALLLSDIDSLSEVIISTIEMCEGKDKDEVIKSWSGGTQLVVSNALGDFDKNQLQTTASSENRIVRF